jgi:hypothetical protein
MFTVGGINQIANLAQALANGDPSIIEEIIADRLENMGGNLISQLLQSVNPNTGSLKRIGKAIETGGASELERMRNEWLSSVTPRASFPGSGMARRLQRAFDKNQHLLSRPGGTALTWEGEGWRDPNKKWIRRWSSTGGHWKWDKSRQQWLDVSYRFDWRTQPRDYHGRWKAGRMKYAYVPKQQRRMRTMRRRAARKMARQIIQGLNKRGP